MEHLLCSSVAQLLKEDSVLWNLFN